MDHLEMKQMILLPDPLHPEVSTETRLLLAEAEARIMRLETGIRALRVAASVKPTVFSR
jgi:hypothetical protein